jgi:hypothetical protein
MAGWNYQRRNQMGGRWPVGVHRNLGSLYPPQQRAHRLSLDCSFDASVFIVEALAWQLRWHILAPLDPRLIDWPKSLDEKADNLTIEIYKSLRHHAVAKLTLALARATRRGRGASDYNLARERDLRCHALVLNHHRLPAAECRLRSTSQLR